MTVVSPTGLCLSFFLPIGLEVSLCQQRRKELTADKTASLCSNNFVGCLWDGWRFMAGMSGGAGPENGPLSAGSSSALGSVKQWAYD